MWLALLAERTLSQTIKNMLKKSKALLFFMVVKETECTNCGLKGKIDLNVKWKYENLRTVGAITVVNLECVNCKSLTMIPVGHETLYSQEEQK